MTIILLLSTAGAASEDEPLLTEDDQPLLTEDDQPLIEE